MTNEAPCDPADYERIAAAIRFIEKRFREQPGLEDIAQHTGLSPFHFQRVFRKLAGVSPKKFLQLRTAAEARTALPVAPSVLGAAHELGLSGGGRLHDLCISIEAMTPGEIRARGAGVEILHGIAPSPFGAMFAARSSRGLMRLVFVDGPQGAREELERMKSEFPAADFATADTETRALITPFFTAGKPGTDLKAWVRGTPFQIKVWEALLRIPEGRTTTYGALAAALGRPRASRAVGSAVGANALALLIPCHRVLRESGALGGYAWGTDRKRSLLAWEAAR